MSTEYADAFVLRAFVCDNGGFYFRGDEGASSLADIFQRRPNQCRYAIVRDACTDQYLAIDLYELLTTTGTDMHVSERKVYPTEDAAIAATHMIYKNL
jgi:hypothetical protein